MEEIVDGLRDSDRTLRYKWDLYGLLFAGAPDTVDGGRPDGYDRGTAKTGFSTFAGEFVKSAGL